MARSYKKLYLSGIGAHVVPACAVPPAPDCKTPFWLLTVIVVDVDAVTKKTPLLALDVADEIIKYWPASPLAAPPVNPPLAVYVVEPATAAAIEVMEPSEVPNRVVALMGAFWYVKVSV